MIAVPLPRFIVYRDFWEGFLSHAYRRSHWRSVGDPRGPVRVLKSQTALTAPSRCVFGVRAQSTERASSIITPIRSAVMTVDLVNKFGY